MHIYLAGKIGKNDWRHTIVDGLRAAFYEDFYDDSHAPGATVAQPGYRWPLLHEAIFGVHGYTGPFFISCSHGCAHGGNSHGVGAGGGTIKYYLDVNQLEDWPEADRDELAWDAGGPFIEVLGAGCISDYAPRQEKVVELCQEAIRRSSLVFAWLDRPDAYGTLVELGFARALGKRIWVAGPTTFPDLWFAYTIADSVSIPQPDARTALQAMLSRMGEYPVPPRAPITRCRSCGAAIVWTKTANQKNVPLDLATIEERHGQQYAIVHFARCPAGRRR